MKSEDEVRSKFHDLRGRRLRQRKDRFLRRYYRNCRHNIRRRVRGNGKCGFCQCEDVLRRVDGGPFVCDEDGPAENCPEFDCRNTPESVEDAFEDVLRNPARCGEEYPKLAILIWFLQDETRRSRWQRFSSTVLGMVQSLFSLILFRWW